jgi:hypothetical protein
MAVATFSCATKVRAEVTRQLGVTAPMTLEGFLNGPLGRDERS